MPTYDPNLVNDIELQSQTLVDKNTEVKALDNNDLNKEVEKLKDEMKESKNKYNAIDKKKPIVSFNEKKDENSIANLCGLNINIPWPNWSWKWKWNLNPNWNFKLPTWKLKMKFCMDSAEKTVNEKKQNSAALKDSGVSENDINESIRISKEQAKKDEITNTQKMVEKEYSNKQENSFVEIYKLMSDSVVAASAIFTPMAAQTTLLQQQALAMGNDLIKCRFRNLLNIPMSPCQKYFFKKIQGLLYNSVIEKSMIAAGVDPSVVSTASALKYGRIVLRPSVLTAFGVPDDIARAAVFPNQYPELSPFLYTPEETLKLSYARGLSTQATSMLLARNGIDYVDSSTISTIYGLVGKDVTNEYGQLDPSKMELGTSFQDMSAASNYLTTPANGYDNSYPDMNRNPEEYKIMMGIENMSNRVEGVNMIVEDITG